MRSLRFILLCAGVAVVSAAGALLWLLLSETPFVIVNLHSTPSQATVFSGNETLGATPLPIKMTPGLKLSLRFVRRECKDAELELNAASFAMPTLAQRLKLAPPSAPYEQTVTLESTTEAELVVRVLPAGAEVFLDGHQLGVAPLAPQRVAPGAHTLRLAHPECFPLSEDISLSPGESLVVERKLENKMVVYYQELMRKEPLVLVHVAELAHHHILRGEFAEAAQVLRDGEPNLAGAEVYQQQKFFIEIVQFYTRYYSYPKGDDAEMRKTCREIVEDAMDKKIGVQPQLKLYSKQLVEYDKNHPPQ